MDAPRQSRPLFAARFPRPSATRRRATGALCALLLAGAAGSAHAYSVSPLRQSIGPSGQDAIGTLRIDNPGASPATLSLEVQRAAIGPDGTLERLPADDDFILFPPQTIVAPTATQNVQVRYVGAPDVAASETYLVTVEQVPVSFDSAENASLSVGINFVVVVTVEPDGAASRPVVASTDAHADGLVVAVRNEGNGTDRLTNYRLRLPGADAPLEIDDKWLGATSILPANGERRFTVPSAALPPGAGDGPASLQPRED